jgi:hypothetical protein
VEFVVGDFFKLANTLFKGRLQQPERKPEGEAKIKPEEKEGEEGNPGEDGEEGEVLPRHQQRKKADVVFLSPPWGGPEYLDHAVYNLECLGTVRAFDRKL